MLSPSREYTDNRSQRSLVMKQMRRCLPRACTFYARETPEADILHIPISIIDYFY